MVGGPGPLDCNLSFPREVLKAGGHFLIRYCSNTTFVADASRPAQELRDAYGRRIVQEWGWLRKVAKADRVYVRGSPSIWPTARSWA